MRNNISRLIEWYHVNLGRVVSLFLLIVVLALLFIYIPFVNIILSPQLSIVIILTSWGILFTPSVKTLVLFAFFVLLMDIILTFFGLDAFVDPLGNIFYFLLIFICVNYAKEVFQMYKNKE
ncbi:MAG: hypothetical protein HYW62_02385 [Candidatus Levybacteria bacterium]|nr:hypothetical protein [Candidatus Levybacteria bacterium]